MKQIFVGGTVIGVASGVANSILFLLLLLFGASPLREQSFVHLPLFLVVYGLGIIYYKERYVLKPFSGAHAITLSFCMSIITAITYFIFITTVFRFSDTLFTEHVDAMVENAHSLIAMQNERGDMSFPDNYEEMIREGTTPKGVAFKIVALSSFFSFCIGIVLGMLMKGRSFLPRKV